MRHFDFELQKSEDNSTCEREHRKDLQGIFLSLWWRAKPCIGKSLQIQAQETGSRGSEAAMLPFRLPMVQQPSIVLVYRVNGYLLPTVHLQ